MATVSSIPDFRVHSPLPLFGGAVAVYLALFFNHLPLSLRYAMVAAGCGVLALELRKVSLHWPLYLLIASVAIEMTSPLGRLPSLSPIDYYCVILAIALAGRIPARDWIPSLQIHFGKTGLRLWLVFLLYGIANAILQNGNPRIVLRWGEFLLVFYTTSLAVSEASEKTRTNACRLLATLGSILALIGVGQFILSKGHYASVVGTFGQNNILAAFLSLCFFASTSLLVRSEKPHALEVGRTSVIMTGLLLTFSRGAWLGVFIAGVSLFLFMAWRQSRQKMRSLRAIAVLMICLGVGILALFQRVRSLTDLSARQYYWQAAGAVLKDRPLTGLGPGNYEKGIRAYLSGLSLYLYDHDLHEKRRFDLWQHLHNLYLQLMVDYGLIGFVLWFAALGALLWPRMQTTLRKGSLSQCLLLGAGVAFLTHNLVDIITVNSLDLLFAMMLAFLDSSLS